MCALAIYEAWVLLNPAEPAGSNPDATSLKLAGDYWSTCGSVPGIKERAAASWSEDFGQIEPRVEPIAADNEATLAPRRSRLARWYCGKLVCLCTTC